MGVETTFSRCRIYHCKVRYFDDYCPFAGGVKDSNPPFFPIAAGGGDDSPSSSAMTFEDDDNDPKKKCRGILSSSAAAAAAAPFLPIIPREQRNQH